MIGVTAMTKLIRTLTMSALMVLAPALAGAQDSWENVPPPNTAQPQDAPPPPSDEQPPAPPQEQPQAFSQPQQQPGQPEAQPSSAAVPPGQWVYTQQYGWIWMPYSESYTVVPANGSGTPYAYVYYPAWSCWTWVAAPWVWGIGPWPWFGYYGPTYYAWYGYGYWRYPSHWHYYPPAYGGGRAWAGYRYPPRQPAPFRPAPAAGARAPYAYRGAAVAPRTGTFARPYGGATFARPGGGFARPFAGGAAPHAGAPHAGGFRGGGGGRGGGGHVGGHGR